MGRERPALLDENGKLRDLSNCIADLTGEFLSQHSFDELGQINPGDLPIVAGPVRLGPCVGASFRLVGIGLNYADHAAESGEDIPSEPVVFIKSTEVSGPNDPIVIPRGSTKTDWEVELGVVIGRQARYVDQEEALSYVAGYCVAHDVSERHWQIERGGQWTKGKSADSFAPFGPWLVTKDEIPDPHSLRLWLEVNGHRYQNSSTSQMVFRVERLVSYLSEIFTLRPGDVIFTGTPSGVGLKAKTRTQVFETRRYRSVRDREAGHSRATGNSLWGMRDQAIKNALQMSVRLLADDLTGALDSAVGRVAGHPFTVCMLSALRFIGA